MPKFESTTPGSSAKLGVSAYGMNAMIEVENAVGASIAVKLEAKDAPAYADAVLHASGTIPGPVKIDGAFFTNIPAYYRVGHGNAQARVNVPDSDTQAARNLNFAVANLRAYVDWVAGADKRAEAKAKAEAEELMLLAVNSRGLRVYNALNKTDHKSWADVSGNSQTLRDKWKVIAEEATKADKERGILDASKLKAGSISSTNITLMPKGTATFAPANTSAAEMMRSLDRGALSLSSAPRYGTHFGY